MSFLTLHNGDPMPILGLGTFRIKTIDELRPVVQQAIRAGYRLIDSATVYRNEQALGTILHEILNDPAFGVSREDLFVTSKLSPQHQGFEKCYQAVLDSLERFGLDYLDLYLIHWPGTAKKKLADPVNRENRLGSYRALEKLHSEGKIRHIGVSNFTARHLKDLLDHCTVVPHVHQFELHPRLVQHDVLALCANANIQVQAYSSLGEGALLHDDAIPVPSDPPALSRAQVLLRWAVQHRWAVIPKSTSPERVAANADIFSFELPHEIMATLDALHKQQEHKFCWDPSDVY